MIVLEVLDFHNIKLVIIKYLNHISNMFILMIIICISYTLKIKYILKCTDIFNHFIIDINL
jgi:hypothetical protein